MGSLENMATVSPDKKVMVVGGGWAGLSCAYALSQRGHQVTLLEAAPQCGGRARSILWPSLGIEVDNGQHILLGAYRAFLSLLQAIGLNPDTVLSRQPFQFSVSGKNKTAHLACKTRPYLPHKLSLILDLCQAKGWTWAEKYRLGQFMAQYIFKHKAVPQDWSVLELLKQARQSQHLIAYFWEPLLVAALSTPLSIASAQYAIEVLKDSFSGTPQNTDILIPTVPLGEVFANPMHTWLTKQGHTVLTHHRVTSLIVSENNTCIGVKAKDKPFYGQVVLALPPRATQQLIQPIACLQHVSKKIAQLNPESIVTVYYAFAQIHATESIPAMQAIVQENQTHYWLFCRQVNNHTILSAVFSGRGPHLVTDKNQLMDRVQADIQTRYPMLRTLVARKHIQEKFAAFSADKLSLSIKPTQQTDLAGLWLCGDYTHQTYPSTLEGAVQSGLSCAASMSGQRLKPWPLWG
jgi:squalene-associated FAD-dependent desaturase